VLDRPASWGGNQGKQTHKMVTVRSGQGAISTDGVHQGATPIRRDSVTQVLGLNAYLRHSSSTGPATDRLLDFRAARAMALGPDEPSYCSCGMPL
jgi:hypothetical protein